MAQLRYFLGANSPAGFYSLYHELLPEEEAEAVFYLKGGPGCGKSSFLRRVAQRAEEGGLDTVLFHCSGDPESLDGLLLPQRRTALMDATAPHTADPSYPGAVGNYVNLGDCYDREGLRTRREEILAVTKEYQSHYPRVYRCLDAAAQLRRDDRDLLLTGELLCRIGKRAEGIIRREIRPGNGKGRVTRRFLDAITHRGRVSLGETALAQADRVITLADSHGFAHELLAPILSAASAAGWDTVACPDPMAPDRLRHLIIPGLSLALLSADPEEDCAGGPRRRVRLDAMADPEVSRSCRPRLRFSRRVAAALEEEAVAALARAKEAHDRLEGLYNPHVDFRRVYALADGLADGLLRP